MDFIDIDTQQIKSNEYNVKPVFCNRASRDIMIRDGKFIAIWDEKESIWKTSKDDVVRLVDESVKEVYDNKVKYAEDKTKYHHLKMEKNSTKLYKEFHEWVKNKEDTCKERILNAKVKFNNDSIKRTDYCSFKLPYDIKDGDRSAYDKITSTLYDKEELEKIEWGIGSVIAGDSKTIQKSIIIFGSPGTGKGTILDIIADMFTLDSDDTYVCSISTKDLVKKDEGFGTAPLKENKLIMIDADANLSRVEDNSVINKIIGHDKLRANSKYGTDPYIKPIGMLFIATNYPVAMSDAKTGLKRRVVIAKSTGNKIEYSQFQKLMKQVKNEYGSIAYHCLEVYKSLGKNYYDDWVPDEMFEFSNAIYSWIQEDWKFNLSKLYPDGINLNNAWSYYKKYCEDAEIKPGTKNDFKIDMIEYFVTKENYHHDGKKDRYFFVCLKEPKQVIHDDSLSVGDEYWLDLKKQKSILDKLYAAEPAQYEVEYEPGKKQPEKKWNKVETKLSDIDTSKVHYVKPSNTHHIFIDFDKRNINGDKDLDLSLKEAREWPETYAETSQSGNGLHLHYIYDGDISKLAPYFDEFIEIKKCNGGSAFRRRLIKCNNVPIAHLKEGDLPLKESNVLKTSGFESIDKTKNVILKALKKGNTGVTATEISLIKAVLDEAYESGVSYDLRYLKNEIIYFAQSSSNQATICMNLISKMHFCSDDICEDDFTDLNSAEYDEAPLAFYDVEVLPNLFIICWKVYGRPSITKMINPTYKQVYDLFCKNRYRWVGFNNKDYDNHIVMHWADCYKTGLKLTNYGLYDISRRIINLKDSNAKRIDAYGLSYTDIYDYAKKKQSLKKWEIELGIHHQELGLPWDQEVPEELWSKVAEYCANDVEATEVVWDATQGDFTARKILAKIANGTPNDSTNKLSAKFIFEGNKHPQNEFNYRFMGAPEPGHTYTIEDDGVTCWQDDGKPIFLGYKYSYGKSSYLDVPLVGEGGYVFAEIGNSNKKADQAGGMYYNVWTFDVSGEHPASIVAEKLWGEYYTARFKEILDLRLAIKHGEFEKAKQMFGGELAEYLNDPEMADVLSGALKLVVNSAYGMTASSKYETAFRDKRNVDNIVAKRGSLFMINLRYLVQKMGYTVVHCKTDSIKVVNPDQKIYDFIMDYGKKFGYTFEIEHKFEKICLVNNAVYIAKLSKDDPVWTKECKKAKEKGEPIPTRWTATGPQFAVPYVFKKLFSHETLEFRDLCETKNVKVGEIYLDFNETLPDVSYYEHLKETKKKIDSGTKTTIKAANQLAEENNPSYDELELKIAEGHDYQFVGRVGLFCPVKDGTGGGTMYRYDGEKYSAVTGTKGYKWKEAEIVKANNLEDTIDESYYISLVNDGIEAISQFGNYDDFVS